MRVATRAAVIGIPFWEKREEPAKLEDIPTDGFEPPTYEERRRVEARLRKRPPDFVKVDPRGTVVAIVDGIVYYNTPSHREDELGV